VSDASVEWRFAETPYKQILFMPPHSLRRYLERGSEHHFFGSSRKSAGRDVGGSCQSNTIWNMKMNESASSSGEIGSYVQLQHEIHDALREQHPEWIEKNGNCPTCESYESRLAQLLNTFQSSGRESAA
jgi:hypothetical protein